MAVVYILYSPKLDKFYVGSCLILEERVNQHKSNKFDDGFTAKADDWEVFFSIPDLEYKQARDIESHIKKMKSKKYVLDLKKYKEMSGKLIEKYK